MAAARLVGEESIDGHADGANRRFDLSCLFPAALVEISLGGTVVGHALCGITGSRSVGVAHDGDDAGLGQASEPRVGGCLRGWKKESRNQGDGWKQTGHQQVREAKDLRRFGMNGVQWNRASKLVAMRVTCASSGGHSLKALGSRAKYHRRRRHHSVGRLSATASSFRVMWKGVRSQPLVVFTSISRVRLSGE